MVVVGRARFVSVAVQAPLDAHRERRALVPVRAVVDDE
jgi:hypothetical protein